MFGRLKWRYDRLRSMSMQEVMWRIDCVARKELYHAAYLLGLLRLAARVEPNISKEALMGERIFNEEYKANYPYAITVATGCADNFMQHRMSLFELDEIFLGKTVDWHLDYKTNRHWPRKFALGIDWRKIEIGDAKYAWEVNRHQFIVPLAKAYFLTHDEVYGRECLNLLIDWVENNQPLEGINWVSSLELSIRLISWSFALHFLWDMLDLTDPGVKKIIRSIVLQASFVDKNLSRFSSANNHRLGEGAGLAVVGLGFPGLSDSGRWAKKGLTLVQEELLRQIYDDGVGKEQSTGYLCFILDLALVTFSFAGMRGHLIRAEIWQRIEAACNYLLAISEDSKTIPRIGDEDDAYAIRFDASVDKARAILSTVGIIRNLKQLRSWAGPLHEKAYWLAGPKFQGWNDLISESNQKAPSKAFEAGGYYILKSTLGNKSVSAMVDCGPLGYLSIAAHGHSDSLSFVLRHGKEDIFIDPGTYLYQCGGRWRDYFKSTRAHNTVTVDGEDQSKSGGTFLWSRHAQSIREVWGVMDAVDVFIGSHHGYTNLQDPVIHRRAVVFLKPDILLLVDKLIGKGSHHYEQYFHFHPQIETSRVANRHWLFRGKETHGCLMSYPMPTGETVAFKGADDPILGWYSPTFGVKLPSTTILNSISQYGDVVLISLIALGTDSVQWEASFTGELISVDIKPDSRKYSLVFSQDLTSPIIGPDKIRLNEALGVITCDTGELIAIVRNGLRRF